MIELYEFRTIFVSPLKIRVVSQIFYIELNDLLFINFYELINSSLFYTETPPLTPPFTFLSDYVSYSSDSYRVHNKHVGF